MVKGHHNVKNCHNKLEMRLNDAVYNNLTKKVNIPCFSLKLLRNLSSDPEIGVKVKHFFNSMDSCMSF